MPPMLMTSSSGWGLKISTVCGAGPGRVRADRVHHLVEDAAAQGVGGAVLAQQFVQLVLAEIVVGELEQGLVDLQAQPDDRPADQGRRPVDRPDEPRAGRPAVRSRGRWLIEQERRVGMLLQEAGGDRVGHRPLDGLLHDRRLVLAEGHEHDLAGVEDGADAHGQRLVRHVLLAEEIAGRVAARHRVERDQPGAAVPRRAGLVEADVARCGRCPASAGRCRRPGECCCSYRRQ